MKVTKILVILLALGSLALSACNSHEDQPESMRNKITATSPKVKDVILTEPYVCQIHAQKYIKLCAMANGYLDAINVTEGQAVEKDKVMFKIRPILYQARWKTEVAEANLAGLELKYTDKLYKDRVVSQNEVNLYQAKLARAEAKRDLAKAELEFTDVRAPFDGIMDRLHMQLGSLVKEGEQLTTLSDTSVMWVYFNVPEKRYLQYMHHRQDVGGSKSREKMQRLKLPESWIELVLADGSSFNKFTDEKVDTVTIEGKFNNETGNIAFRADFPNPEGLLRHGQTGKVVVHRKLTNAVVIPQRAVFEVLSKLYVFIIDKDNKIQRREIAVEYEKPDMYVIKPLATVTVEQDGEKTEYPVGVAPDEKFILEGVRAVHDGESREYEFVDPDKALSTQKHHAE